MAQPCTLMPHLTHRLPLHAPHTLADALLSANHAQRHSQSSKPPTFKVAAACACDLQCCLLQYHYRPGTFTGWLAHVLDDYSQRRKSESASSIKPLPLHQEL